MLILYVISWKIGSCIWDFPVGNGGIGDKCKHFCPQFRLFYTFDPINTP